MKLHIQIFLLLISTVSVAPAEVVKKAGKIVSRAHAQIGDEVLTTRDVIISGVIDRALLLDGVRPKKFSRKDWILTEANPIFKQQLTQLVLEVVLSLEAKSFQWQVDPQQVSDQLRKIGNLLQDWPEWIALHVSEDELKVAITRKISGKNGMKLKTESSGVVVSDDETKQYYEKNRVRFGELPYEKFKGTIKEYLSQERLKENLSDWFEALKRQYKVRYLGSVP